MTARMIARTARLFAVLTLLLTSCLVLNGSASAGGPTSAILVAPGSERAVALYHSDPEYQQLEMLLAEPQPSVSSTDTPEPGSAYITVTWLIHDVSVWRIDRIFLSASAEPLIITQLDTSTASGDGMYPGQSGNDTAVHHRPADPGVLLDLLGTLGLTGAGQPPAAEVALQVAPGAIEAAAPATSTNSAAAWWAIAGLMVGIAATFLAGRFLPVVRRRMVTDPQTAGTAAFERPADAEPVPMVKLAVRDGR